MFKFRIPLVIVLLMGPIAVGCGDDGTTGPSAVLAPPPAGQGLQIKMTSTLEAGLETERCMFYRVPAEGLAVNRQEIRYTPGSHHVLLFKTPYTEIPTTTIDGRTVDTRGCSTAAQTAPRATGRSPASLAARSPPPARPASTACRATPRSRSTATACCSSTRTI